MATDNFSAEDSLRVIQQMIDRSRRNIYYQSPYFLLWGWSTLFACVGQFLLKTVFNYPHHYIVWLITIPCAVITIIYAARKARTRKVKTYVDESMNFLWTGTGISFFVLSLVFVKIGWFFCYPFYMILYGLGAFVSGRLLQFKPFIVGGIISWILAAVAIWFGFDQQTLFAAAAILFSYIIPGHMIRKMETNDKYSRDVFISE